MNDGGSRYNTRYNNADNTYYTNNPTFDRTRVDRRAYRRQRNILNNPNVNGSLQNGTTYSGNLTENNTPTATARRNQRMNSATADDTTANTTARTRAQRINLTENNATARILNQRMNSTDDTTNATARIRTQKINSAENDAANNGNLLTGNAITHTAA
jgi:hypothetical protein